MVCGSKPTRTLDEASCRGMGGERVDTWDVGVGNRLILKIWERGQQGRHPSVRLEEVVHASGADASACNVALTFNGKRDRVNYLTMLSFSLDSEPQPRESD